MSDIQPVALPNPPKVIYTCMWLWCDGVSVLQGAVPFQQHWHHVRAIRGAHQLSEQACAHAPSPCLSTNHEPLEISQIVVVKL
jgi:hypothetical protein